MVIRENSIDGEAILKPRRLLLSSLAASAILFGFGDGDALADNDFLVYSPHVVQGETEIETYGFAYQDSNSELNGTRGYNLSIAHGVTRWWKAELYASYNRVPEGTTALSSYEFENTFQLTTPGQFWADLGFVASYVYSKQPDVPNGSEFGPLFEKMSGPIDQRLNLLWEKDIGAGASGKYTFRSSYSISYKIDFTKASFSPGIEAYYRPGDSASHIGPVFYGEFQTGEDSAVDYSFGVVFGVNPGAADKTYLFRLGYEL